MFISIFIQKLKSKIFLDLSKNTNETSDIMGFIKKFIRYDYLGNIYSLTTKQYIKYLNDSYKKFIEVTNSTFINIMKNFIANGSEIKKMFESILLLLLGSDDNADVAGLLLGLTKEKKTNSMFIYNYINQRLPYYLLVRIKKSSNNIKAELDKLKALSTDDVDYKKQLITNKNIPQNINP